MVKAVFRGRPDGCSIGVRQLRTRRRTCRPVATRRKGRSANEKFQTDQQRDYDRNAMCFAAPQAEAIEIYGAGTAVTQLDDGLFVQARGGGGHARHGGGHVAHRGNVHVANRHVSRNVNRNVNRSGHWGNWARPGGYWWPAGGAVAAGAALGFISAAAAASWAGAAPGPNLCWYYTNPSQQQGYWDACP